jgi:hypothetical protein
MVTLLAPLLRGQQTLWAGPLGYRDTALYANFWKIVALGVPPLLTGFTAARQIAQVARSVGIELQGASNPADDGLGGMSITALLEALVVRDANAGQPGDLVTPQTRHPPPPVRR